MTEYVHKAASGGKPDSLVIFLHGYGSNGQDLIGLAPVWEKELPNTEFVSPDAHAPCEMGFGFQWFSLRSWMPADMLAAARPAADWLNAYIDQKIAQYGLTPDRVVLVGFSQGTMMSLLVAPYRKKALGGVLGYSGALLGGEELTKEGVTLSRLPIHLIHGDLDPVVTVAAWYHSTEALRKAEFIVTGNVTRGLVHSIDQRGLDDGLFFIQKTLKLLPGP